MKNKKLELFLSFANIGAFTFGGGYAMIPLLQKEVVENKKWISENEMLDITAISQSTPGPLAIIKAGVIVLILEAAIKLSKQLKHNWFNFILLTASFLITVFTSINVIYVLIVCALLGVIVHGLNLVKGGID